MNQSAAIFDMDGLLLDTDPKIWLESMQEVAHRHNIPISTELLKFTKGLRIFEVTNFWNEYLGWNDKPKSVRVAEEIIDTVIASAKKSGRVMPEYKPCLAHCRSMTYRWVWPHHRRSAWCMSCCSTLISISISLRYTLQIIVSWANLILRFISTVPEH